MPRDRAPRGGKPAGSRPSRSGGDASGPSRFGEGRPARGAKPTGRFGKPSGEGRPAKPAFGEDRPARGAKPTRGAKPSFGEDRPAREDRAPRGERPARGAAKPPRAAAGPRGQREVSFDNQGRRDVVEVQDERNDIVFGRHPALAALEGEGTVNKVWVLNGLRNQELLAKVRQLAKEKGATVQTVERPKLDQLTNDGNHQGIVVSLAMAAYVELEDVIEKAKEREYPSLLLLDGIEDPHNLGALIRSAEGAGFAGVVISARRQVGLTPVVAKASAGAIARVPVARVGNLGQAAKTLKDAGFWLVGADAHGQQTPYEVDLAVPLVLVIGGEGKGLGKLLGEKCDFLVKLPLGGELESLNASVAGGVLMYEAVRQRWAKGRQG